MSLLLFLIGLFTKEAAIVVPPLLMLFDYFFISKSGRGLMSRLKYHIPYILLTSVLFLVYLSYLTRPEADRPWGVHIPTELSVFIEYLKLLFIPLGLTIDHDVMPLSLGSGRALFSLVLVMSLLALAVIIRKTKPAVSFAILWFFISLSPFLAIRVNDFMAERWVYTASIGFAVGTAGAVMWTSQLSRKTVVAVVVAMLFLLGTLTVMRNQIYASPVLLWEDAARKAPEKPRPYLNLSQANIDNGDLAQGVANIQKGLELGKKRGFPRKGRVVAYINLAAAYQYNNDFQRAEEALKMVEQEASVYPEYHHSLGLLYMKTRRNDQALAEFNKALAIRPRSPTYLYLIGACYEALGQQKAAKDFFSRASAGIPQSGPDYVNQSLAFSKLGEEERFLELLFEGVKADPFDLGTRLSFADALLHRQLYDAAWKHYSIAATVAPRSAAAYRGMGIVLLSRGERREASIYFEKALGILPPDSPERKNLLELLNKTKV
jgi:tetratricopeptide (TPR) repeat protein